MKKIIYTSVVALAVMAQMASAQFKVAVVDLQKVFQDYNKTKEAESVLKERMAGFQKERQDMLADYQKMVEETRKLRDAATDKTLNETARNEKQKAFETKVQDVANRERSIREFELQRQRQFEDQSRRMRQGIVEEIIKFVNDEAGKGKYNKFSST